MGTAFNGWSAAKRWLVAGCVGAMLVPRLTFAAPEPEAPVVGAAAPMGLSEAYRLALQNDASLSASRWQVESLNERVVQAQAQLRPNVSLSVSRFNNHLTRTQPDVLGRTSTTEERYYSYNQTLQLRQPLYRPGVVAGVDVAQAQRADGVALLERDVQSTAVRVVDAYLAALQSQEAETLLHVQMGAAQRQLDAAQKRFEAGQGVRTDVDEMIARLDLIAAQLLEAKQSRETALLQLRLITQQPVNAVRGLDVAALDLNGFSAADLDGWVRRVLTNSPELKALEARVEAARQEVRRARFGHAPSLDALAQIGRSGNESVTSTNSAYVNRQIGLQLNVPLYAGGAVQSAVRQALAEQSRAEELLEAARRDAEVRVQREWRGMVEGAHRALALQKALLSADRVVTSVSRSFDAGTRSVLDVLNAEDRRQQTQRDFVTACLAHITSRLRLHALVGELDEPRMAQADAWFLTRP